MRGRGRGCPGDAGVGVPVKGVVMAEMKKERNCENCRFFYSETWIEISTSVDRFVTIKTEHERVKQCCRRFPKNEPKSASDWCGEFLVKFR